MITLASICRIPAHVSFTQVDHDAVLLNTATKKYFALDEVGARLWTLLAADGSIEHAHAVLLTEYAVSADQLSADLLELINDLARNGLLEIDPA
jgi:hypothetical protein